MVFKIVAFSIAAIIYTILLGTKEIFYSDVHRAWPINANRDTKAYVLPDINTTIHEPQNVCTGQETKNNKLFLLVFVHSSTNNLKGRLGVRDSWGYYDSYKIIAKSINSFQEKQGNEVSVEANNTAELPDFKVVFLLGVPNKTESPKDTQNKIDTEAAQYGDILQENFVDSYQNLTVKTVMMLKWVTRKCKDSVSYIMKTDDDVYLNLPLVTRYLRTRSDEFNKKLQEGYTGKQYEIYGHKHCNITPISSRETKWYSPRYMYTKSQYPCYMHGYMYMMTSAAAEVLYEAALRTPLYHIEDVYISGLCREAASVPVEAVDANRVLDYDIKCRLYSLCGILSKTVCHSVESTVMSLIHNIMINPERNRRCLRENEMKKTIRAKLNQHHDAAGEITARLFDSMFDKF